MQDTDDEGKAHILLPRKMNSMRSRSMNGKVKVTKFDMLNEWLGDRKIATCKRANLTLPVQFNSTSAIENYTFSYR